MKRFWFGMFFLGIAGIGLVTFGQNRVEAPKITLSPLPPEELKAAPTAAGADLAINLILDASGSMKGLLGNSTKMDLVEDTLADLALHWGRMQESSLAMGVRTFGSGQPAESKSCDDSQSIHPVSPIETFKADVVLGTIDPKGVSPLAYALQQGAGDLKSAGGDKMMVLLTDGKESCGEDPCAVAKSLFETEQIVTHVVAFDIPSVEEASIKCIAENSGGRYFLARTREELITGLDEAMRSRFPYNLRLKVSVGALPVPNLLTIYKAGTQQVVLERENFGVELLSLNPGSYDVLVEYTGSVFQSKPSKILKGIAVSEAGKLEQEIRFELGPLTLEATDHAGNPAETEFVLRPTGTETEVSRFVTDGKKKTLFIKPGKYDLVAKRIGGDQEMTLSETGLDIGLDIGLEKSFLFQLGRLFLIGTTAQGEKVPFTYKIFSAANKELPVAEGNFPKEGGEVELPPGIFTVRIWGMDEKVQVKPVGQKEKITIAAGGRAEETVALESGQLNLRVVKAGKEPALSEIFIEESETSTLVTQLTAEEGKASLALPPGKYNISAKLLSTRYENPPTIDEKNIEIKSGKSKDVLLRFTLGTIKILGRNTKEKRLVTTFTVYESGDDDVIAQFKESNDWVQFDLSPGVYDIRAENMEAKEETRPTLWQREIEVMANTLTVREMVFTNAKLRLIGRGINNEIIPVGFKIYKYGQDRPILSGMTGQDWEIYDIHPDSYYIEASYHDYASSQTLKKWISLKVLENQLVEKELRF